MDSAPSPLDVYFRNVCGTRQVSVNDFTRIRTGLNVSGRGQIWRQWLHTERALLPNSYHDVDLRRRRRILPWTKFLRVPTPVCCEKET